MRLAAAVTMGAPPKTIDITTPEKPRLVKNAFVPLAQEMVVLDQSRGNLLEWRQSIYGESRGALEALLLVNEHLEAELHQLYAAISRVGQTGECLETMH